MVLGAPGINHYPKHSKTLIRSTPPSQASGFEISQTAKNRGRYQARLPDELRCPRQADHHLPLFVVGDPGLRLPLEHVPRCAKGHQDEG